MYFYHGVHPHICTSPPRRGTFNVCSCSRRWFVANIAEPHHQTHAVNLPVETISLTELKPLLPPTAGTISGEEVPIVSKTNIKEYRDSFSSEKFSFRSNPNITFYVYVSNFSWPIKIQVRSPCHVPFELPVCVWSSHVY